MEIKLSKKDFKVDYFSGTGPGGQHRNKSQVCCRITHIETGLSAQCTEHRSRTQNQRQAFRVLAARIVAHWEATYQPERPNSDVRVRTYNEARNEVIDHGSGLRLPYTQVVGKNDLSEMIDARAMAMRQKELGDN